MAAPTPAVLTGLTASFTLPSGVNSKVARAFLTENHRWKDSEGFVDGGFQTGVLTGQRLAGRIVGFVTGTAPVGIGSSLENVNVTITLDSGRAVTFNSTWTDIEVGASTGEVTAMSGSFVSNGTYTGGTL